MLLLLCMKMIYYLALEHKAIRYFFPFLPLCYAFRFASLWSRRARAKRLEASNLAKRFQHLASPVGCSLLIEHSSDAKHGNQYADTSAPRTQLTPTHTLLCRSSTPTREIHASLVPFDVWRRRRRGCGCLH